MPCKLCGKDSGRFYDGYCPECLVDWAKHAEEMYSTIVQRAEAAESRVRELEQRVVDMRDRVLLERERREQVEASCAAAECPKCFGTGKEICNNPDHGFIDAVGGEVGRLGCPCCGHDPQRAIPGTTCDMCGGSGRVRLPDLLERMEKLEQELEEGDYWFKRLESFISNGGCPFCLASDGDGGHEDGCEMGQLEERAEAAEARVRELEISNASLIGVVDNLIIETRKMIQVAGGELEASCAVMRDALEQAKRWVERLHVYCPRYDETKYEIHGTLRTALSTTAGRDLLRRLEKLERVAEAIQGHDITLLHNKAKQLKGTDGEGWAVGEMLERALVALDGAEGREGE